MLWTPIGGVNSVYRPPMPELCQFRLFAASAKQFANGGETWDTQLTIRRV
ncbi:MAG: hypothetical protein ACJA0K_000752 [Maricaulis maris]|jgi:hypothetical protein